MLVQELKRCINFDVKSFLNEKEVEILEKAVRPADDYFTVTHKLSFVNKANPIKIFYSPSGPKPSASLQSGSSSQKTHKPKPPGENAHLQLLQTIRSYCF